MLLKKLTIDKIGKQLVNQKVLMRVDFNVPIKNGQITDETRIIESLPTINYAYEQGAKSIVLLSHMGRPNGEKNLKYSLEPIAPVLSKHLGRDVEFLNDCVGENVEKVNLKL
jgi:phosphoglycerate kinase